MAKDAAKRKAGAQEGHRGAGRRLAPEDQLDEIVDHYPARVWWLRWRVR